jgi:hypothetical protein
MYRTVVTMYTTSLTLNNSPFCPHTVFMCFVWISEQTAIIPLQSTSAGWIREKRWSGDREICYHTHCCCCYVVIGSRNRPFPPVLLKQHWPPPLRLQVSDCSTCRVLCDVPSTAVFCCEFVIIIITFFGAKQEMCCRDSLRTVPDRPIVDKLEIKWSVDTTPPALLSLSV